MENGKIGVFRLNDYAKRFKNSAKIMGMPEIDEDLFKSCILKYLDCCRKLVPTEEGHSLYIRPLMIATDPVIKVKSSKNYRFMIMSSVVGPYFTSGKEGVKVFCNETFTRAFPAGTGEAKTAANYALSLPHLNVAQSFGYEQVLYLDSVLHKNIEELGGMNFFMLKENQIVTPKLSGTILKGITRDSILCIAKFFNYEVIEREISIDEIINESDKISVFTTGTAAVVVPVLEIGFQKQGEEELVKVNFSVHSAISKLRDHLLKTQYNKTPLSKEWLTIL